jgi:transcriptional regulator of acetoin/glycerol metabolism
MCEERKKVRCNLCELVQWGHRPNCRRCGTPLPQPVVNIVERVVEKVVIRQDPECIRTLTQVLQLISATTDRVIQKGVEAVTPIIVAHVTEADAFPTIAEVERGMILAAYQRSNRRPNEAARMLGIGKTTLYRKLRRDRP